MAIFSGIGRFFGWWFGELQSALPRSLRSRLNEGGDQLRLLLAEGGARLQTGPGRASRDLGQVNFEPDNPQKERSTVQRLLRRGRTRGRDATILLADDKVLRPQVELPQAAAENLEEVLSFEMDRNTPFRADEVYFDHRVCATDKEAKRITVELGVVLRNEVEQALRVARSWGLRPARIAVAGEAGVPLFDLMPHGERQPRGRMLKQMSGALAITACVLVGVTLYLPLKQKEDRLAATQARLEQVRVEAAAAGKLQDQMEAMLARDSFVVDRKHATPAVVTLLHDVTQVLPDDTWLIHFSWRQGQLRLAGYSHQPTALIRLLEESDFLSDVSFASPVTLDPRLGVERFNIAARIAKGEEAEAQ